MTNAMKCIPSASVESISKHYTKIFNSCDGDTDLFFRKINTLFEAKSIVLVPDRLYQLELNNAYINKQNLTDIMDSLLTEYSPQINWYKADDSDPDISVYRIKLTKKKNVL